MRKEFRSLVSLEDARSMVLGHPLISEDGAVPLEHALGRVLAEKVISGVDVPGFNRASMDGYAVFAKDTIDAREDRPVVLKLVGSVPMGARPSLEVGRGEAAEVSTGSMMPSKANAVVMIEYSEVEKGQALIRRPVHTGENVQAAGSDISLGEAVLFPGTRLGARELGVLAALGRDSVLIRSLRVGVASTGNELVHPGSPLCPGQIYDINSYSIAAAVEECGATAVRYDILQDDKAAMAETLQKMAKECSMILVSGSTSAGAGDMVYQVLDDVGKTVFHGVNLKPGKPTIFGTIRNKPCLGLPGYPTSALTVFELLAAPAIRRALGLKARERKIAGRLAVSVRSEGRHQMLAVGVSRDIVYPMDKGSGSITTLAQADGAIEISSEVEYIERGEPVEVRLFGELNMPDLTIAGENCPVLEAIIAKLPYQVRLVSNGGRRGLLAALDGITDLASISSREGERQDIPDGFVLIRGYNRRLGLIAKDSAFFEPERIAEACIIGWSRDSEMNRLFQRSLQEMGQDLKDLHIAGQARSHSAAAAAVASGKADLGFGAMAVAKERGLLFKEIASDRMDFLAAVSGLENDAVKSFISYLKSDELRGALPAGISMDESAGKLESNLLLSSNEHKEAL